MSDSRWVSNEQLERELKKLPTRWEVRFLILIGFFGSQFVPLNEVAKAAVKILG